MRGSRLDHLEELAEELIKEKPEESVVKAHMKSLNLSDPQDACQRLELILSQLDQARKNRSRKTPADAKDLR